MKLDFGKLGGRNIADEATEPRKIFTALTDRKYAYPRDVQSEVWEKWYQKRASKDVVVKMNTGSGKTVVGLLMLKSCLNEKVGPSVFFTPDKYLTEQVLSEAKLMKIPVTTDEHSAEFISGKAILVTNIHKLFNGKSVFGVGDEGVKINIGSLVLDDAHACLSTIKEKFTLRLSSTHAAYQRIWDIVKNSLFEQSPSKVLEVESGDPIAQMRVPFWTWQKESGTITKILHDYRTDKELMFVWPLIKTSLEHCHCIVGAGVLEISPSFTPVDIIPSFKNAQRRIYMSATISDETILVAELKANQDSIRELVVPNSGDDLGDRMILFPQQVNPSISDEQLRDFFKARSKQYNTVVLVPSKNRAKFWEPVADLILDGDNIGRSVEDMKNKLVGLVVLVNRYDGIDLPGDAARILVIDGIPTAQSHREKIENGILNQSDLFLEKKINKIEQGMGRGTRSNEDYCVVCLMNPALAGLLYSPKARSKFSAATLAQLNLADKVADQLKGKGLAEISQVMDECLNRSPGWVEASKSVLESIVPSKEGRFSDGILAQSKANDLSILGQHRQAVACIVEAANKTQDDVVKGFLLQHAAEIINFYDSSESQQTLLSGLSRNRNILRPLKGINYSKINFGKTLQSELAVGFYKEQFLEPNDCLIVVNSVLEDLQFEEDTAKAFESAIEFLGRLLGFVAQRPDNEYGVGPDVLWATGDLKYFVIECKNGVKIENSVTKNHANQLSSAQNWFANTYDKSCESIQLMIHPNAELEGAAFVSESMRVIDSEKLSLLRSEVREFFRGLCHSGNLYEPSKVQEKIVHHGFSRDQLLAKFTKSFVKRK